MPWLGMGMSIYHNQLTKRHSINETKSVLQEESDKIENIVGLVFSAANEWPIATHLDITTHIEHFIGFGNNQRVSSFKIAILYRY